MQSPVNGVTSRAMLAAFTVTTWSGRRYDRKVSDEIAVQHGADQDAGRYNKRLVAKASLENLERIVREASVYHRFVSLPWLNDGARIFPSAVYFDYVSRMGNFEREFDAAADKFAWAYPQVVDDAKGRLNGLFNAADYPSARAIRSKFSFKTTLFPLPDAGDFRVDLGDADVARLQAQFQKTRDDLFASAIKDVVARIQDVVGRMSERLHAYHVDDKGVHGIFRDTLVSNVRDLAQILPALNVTADRNLDELIERIQSSLTKHDADVLREDQEAREETAAAADEILSHVSAFFA